MKRNAAAETQDQAALIISCRLKNAIIKKTAKQRRSHRVVVDRNIAIDSGENDGALYEHSAVVIEMDLQLVHAKADLSCDRPNKRC